jgi:ATP-dependent RNA helicase RhlE
MSFNALGLMPSLQHTVSALGYKEPTPIQKKAIPVILEGKDVMGGAQTGTGKTAAFALPVLQILEKQNRRERAPRVLVLAPTRELAAQVYGSFVEYGDRLHQRAAVIFGGVNINPQINTLRRGVDILVACPGRLLDHAAQGTLDLSRVSILILDEADRMLDMGFIHDIRKVMKLLPAKRQSLLFSATYSLEIRELAKKVLHQPVLVEVARKNTAAEKVDQIVHPVAQNQKRHLLAHLIESQDWRQVLVFTRTKHGANRLTGQLAQKGIVSEAIHGNKSQQARTKALAKFKENHIRVLVATDIAARGIDIDHLSHVVNFDLPNVPEDYVHRIGRTGRAGASGMAVSLVAEQDQKLLRQIERVLGKKIPRRRIDGFDTSGPAPSDAPTASSPAPSSQEQRANGQRAGQKRKRRRRRSFGRTAQRRTA